MKCVVLGAGVAGLVAALELQRRDCQVTLVEAAPFAGGRASSWQTASGLDVGTGLHVVADHYVNLLDVLTSIDATRHIVWWNQHYYLRPGQRGLLWRYNRLPAPFHLLYTARAMPVPLSTRWRLMRVGLDVARYRQRDLRCLDEQSYLQWHKSHGLVDDFLLGLAEWAADAATFLPMEKVSARAVLSWLKYMSRSSAAARIGTWCVPLAEGLVAPLVNAIRRLGGVVRWRTAAIGLAGDERGVRGVVVRPSTALGPCYEADGRVGVSGPQEEIPCDVLISALPVQALRQLVDPPLASHAGLSEALKLQTVPAIAVVVSFDRKIRPAPPGAPLVTGCAMRDFIDLSALWRHREEISVYQFLVSKAGEWMARRDDEIIQALLRDLYSVWHGSRGALPVEANVERIGAAMFAATAGSYRLRPKVETKVPNFFLAGDWIRHDLNASMEGAALSGRLAAQAALRGRARIGVRILQPDEALFSRALQALVKPLTQGCRSAA